jgi:hypothetical protein
MLPITGQWNIELNVTCDDMNRKLYGFVVMRVGKEKLFYNCNVVTITSRLTINVGI